jgi:predicted aminopeptidase
MHARRSIYASLPPPSAAGPRPASGEAGLPPQIGELLNTASTALAATNCEDYYQKLMSPNFRKVTSKKAMEALIQNCKNSIGTREMLAAAVRIVKDMVPSFEYEGRRAVYDVSGQGLPFDRFVLEQVDKKWYIAE